jgi:3-oxoacyl-[acyl-carrier protein] reductase
LIEPAQRKFDGAVSWRSRRILVMADPGQQPDGTRPAPSGRSRPTALITGVGRTIGIGAGIASQLAASGWDIAFTFWTAYDERMNWGTEAGATDAIARAWAALPRPARRRSHHRPHQ